MAFAKIMNFRFVLAIGAALFGLMTTLARADEQPALAGEIAEVSAEQLPQFWDLGDALQGQSKPRFRKNIQYGCVRVVFTINGEGEIVEPRILKSVPAQQFDAFVLETLADIEADATDSNAEQKPVRSSQTLALARGDSDVQIINNPGIAKLCQ